MALSEGNAGMSTVDSPHKGAVIWIVYIQVVDGVKHESVNFVNIGSGNGLLGAKPLAEAMLAYCHLDS